MAFGLIRARNLGAGDIGNTDLHNARLYKKLEDYPANIDSKKTIENNVYFFSSEEKKIKTLSEAIEQRIKINNVTGIKKNSNLAIEYVVGINDKNAWIHYDFGGFVSNTEKWLEARHGKGSVVAVYSHLDETNPHAHIVVVPIEEKTIQWKNSNGSGERTEKRLNTREYTGGREKLRKLQDDYFNHLVSRYDGGKRLGLELYRGTLVENQAKDYSKHTNHEIAHLKSLLGDLSDEEEKKLVQSQIAQKERYLALNEIKLKNEQDRRNSERKNIWQKKGTKDNPDIFHSKTESEEKRPQKRSGFKR